LVRAGYGSDHIVAGVAQTDATKAGRCTKAKNKSQPASFLLL